LREAVFFCCGVLAVQPARGPDAMKAAKRIYEIIFLKTTDFNANIRPFE
jgi:hypothetical protein